MRNRLDASRGRAPASGRDRAALLASVEESQRRYLRPGECFAIDPGIVQQEGPRAFFWLFGPPTYANERCGSVTIVRVNGPLEHHAEGWGDNYDSIVARVTAAMTGNDRVQRHREENEGRKGYKPIEAEPPAIVVLKLDSPGGVVAGLHQTVEKLRKLSKQYGIPLVAYVDEMAYSASFAIACACERIVLPPSGFLGSIGVISTMVDQTARDRKEGYRFVVLTSGKRKADGHPHVPMTDEMLEIERPRVEKLARFFFEDVREARGLSIATIRGFQAGRFLGEDAKDAGLADDVMGWDALLEELNASAEQQTRDADGSHTTSDGQQAAQSETPMTIEALIARTEKALAAEKDTKKRAKLAAELVNYQATLAAVSAKAAKGDETNRKEKDAADDDDDDADDDDDSDDADEEEEEEEESSDEEESDEDDDEDEDDEDDEDDEEEEEDEARVHAAAVASAREGLRVARRSGKKDEVRRAKAYVRTAKQAAASTTALSSKFHKLFAACQRATGKRGLRAVIGGIDALKVSAKTTEKVAAEVANIKARQRRERVDALLSDARKSGKITKVEAQSLRAQGVKDPRWLKGYLECLPKRIRGVDDGALVGKAKNGSTDADAARTDALDLQNMSPDQRKAVETMARDSGKTFDEFVGDMKQRSAGLLSAGHANGVR